MSTYYVDPTGNDANPGSSGSPWLTIQHAVTVATTAGDIINVRNGTYTPSVATVDAMACNLTAAGVNALGPITIRAVSLLGAKLDGNGTAHSWFNITSTAAWYVIDGFEITNTRWGALWSNSGAVGNILFQNCYVHHIGNRSETSTFGIVGVYTDALAVMTVYNCRFEHIGRTNNAGNSFDHDIYSHGTMVIIDNIFIDMLTGWGIQCASGFGGSIIGNQFFGPNEYTGAVKAGQIMLWDTEGSAVINNNVFYNPNICAITHYNLSIASLSLTGNQVYGTGITLLDFDGPTVAANTVQPTGSWGGGIPSGSGVGTSGGSTGAGGTGSGGASGGASPDTAPLVAAPALPIGILYHNGFDWPATHTHLARDCTSASFNFFGGFVPGRNGIGQALNGQIQKTVDGYEHNTLCIGFAIKTGTSNEFLHLWGNFQLVVETLADGRIRFRENTTAVVPGFVVIPNTWYFFVVKVSYTSSGGNRTCNYEFYVNNALIQASSFTTGGGLPQFSYFDIGRNSTIDDLYVTDGEVLPENHIYTIFPNVVGSSTQWSPLGIIPRRANASIDTGSPLYTNLLALFYCAEGLGSNTRNLVSGVNAGLGGPFVGWGGNNPTNAFNYIQNDFIQTTEAALLSVISHQCTFVVKTRMFAAPNGNPVNVVNLFSGIFVSVNADLSVGVTIARATTNLIVTSPPGTFPLGVWVQIVMTWDGSTTPSTSNVHIYLDQVELTYPVSFVGSGALAGPSSGLRFNEVVNVVGTTENPDNLLMYAALYQNRILNTSEMLALDTDATFPITGGTPVTLNNFDYVRDHDPDDDASYVTTPNIGDKDLWNMEDVPAGPVYFVGGRHCLSKSGAGISSVEGITKVSGVEEIEPEFFPSYGSWLYQRYAFRKNPVTGNDFTTSEVNAIQRGIIRIS